jgi:hypothetical protein
VQVVVTMKVASGLIAVVDCSRVAACAHIRKVDVALL